MRSEYSPNEEERLARLRDRIGTSTTAIRRRQILDEHVRSNLGRPFDADEFRSSFLDVTKKLQRADSFLPTHVPTFIGPTHHVFGPSNYDLEAGYADDVSGADIGAKADRTTGELSVSEFTIKGETSAFAIVGVNFSPTVDCHLSVRPYVNWSGFDHMYSHDAEPDLHGQAIVTTYGEVGIYIISSTPSGELWNVDFNHWWPQWPDPMVTYSNPPLNTMHSYDGTVSSSSVLEVDGLLVEAGRLYEIQVGIRVHVSVSPAFSVTAGATAGMSATVPFFVVEETLH